MFFLLASIKILRTESNLNGYGYFQELFTINVEPQILDVLENIF